MATVPNITTLLRARTTFLWVSTREELRVERAIVEAAGKVGFSAVFWDCDQGLTDPTGKPTKQGANAKDPEAALKAMRGDGTRAVWIFRDLDRWLVAPTTSRAVKSLARDLEAAPAGQERTIVVLTPKSQIPDDLAGCPHLIDWPLPDREDVGKILDATVEATISGLRAKSSDPKVKARLDALQLVTQNGVRESCVDAAVGLTAKEVSDCYARSLVEAKTIDPDRVRKDKASVVSGIPGIEWYEPEPLGLDAIGGLDVLKRWLLQRRLAFSQKAKDYGLPAPKGVFLAGISGCGKSLTAKCISAAWGMPLLRLDLGGLKSKFVGESEGNIRRALKIAESVAPCIVWADELDKSLAGSTGMQGDGGVASDALGTLLTWQQERRGMCFLVATANDVSGLPPELLRKGRFDEMFFIDLPSFSEREEIFAAAIRQYKRDPERFDLGELASLSSDFTGAEIAAVVPDGLFAAFAADREPTTEDFASVARSTVPLAQTASERIKAMREWAQGRAKRASTPAPAEFAQMRGAVISD